MNEEALRDMKSQISAYKEKGIHGAAKRLEGQLEFIEQNLVNSIQKKLDKLTSQPLKYESRLNRAMGELRNIERHSCILDIPSAGPDNVEDQHDHCLKIYRTLSEIKSDVESVIKTGRKVCEDKTSLHSQMLTKKIDTLKNLYNSLGENVTQCKIVLEGLIGLKRTIEENLGRIENWMNFHESNRDSIESPQRDSDDDHNLSLKDVMELFGKCDELVDEYKQTCDAVHLQAIVDRIDELKMHFSRISNADAVKLLNETKSTLQNLDTISIENLR